MWQNSRPWVVVFFSSSDGSHELRRFFLFFFSETVQSISAIYQTAWIIEKRETGWAKWSACRAEDSYKELSRIFWGSTSSNLRVSPPSVSSEVHRAWLQVLPAQSMTFYRCRSEWEGAVSPSQSWRCFQKKKPQKTRRISEEMYKQSKQHCAANCDFKMPMLIKTTEIGNTFRNVRGDFFFLHLDKKFWLRDLFIIV